MSKENIRETIYNVREKKYTRRDVLKAAGVIGAGAIASGAAVAMVETAPPLDSDLVARRREYRGELFNDPLANETAKERGISVDSFLNFSRVNFENMRAMESDQLFPIFPPSVIDNKKLIYSMSDQYNVPPNIIASLVSIESAGNPHAEQEGAQGLFQVLPYHFQEAGYYDLQTMRTPEVNAKIGMEYFTKECISKAENYGELVDPRVAAVAFIGYSAGPEAIRENIDFENLPEKSKFMGDHYIRFALTAELAEGLRQAGKSDVDIVKGLSSVDIDGRAFALSQLINAKGGNYTYTEYVNMLNALSFPGSGASSYDATIRNSYYPYVMNPFYKYPASPGLRFWLTMGGEDLYNQDKRNTDPRAWTHINTERNA